MKTLRFVLRLNGGSCVAFGLLFMLAPARVASFLAEQASSAPPVVIAVLGAGLLINGVALFLTARADSPRRSALWLFSIGDLLWVIATLVLIASGIWIERTWGIIASLLVALFVGSVGLLQWRALDRPSAGNDASRSKIS